MKTDMGRPAGCGKKREPWAPSASKRPTGRRRALALLLALLTLLLTACAGAPSAAGNEKQTGGEAMTSMELTEREIELLSAAYPNEDMIREGLLLDYQKQALEFLRAGEAYLAARYPDEDIRILNFIQANKFNPWAELRFRRGEGEKDYTAVIAPTETGFSVSDTLCGELIAPAYDALVEKTLREAGFRALSLTVFPNPIGGDLDPYGPAEELLRLYPHLKRSTRLFLAAADEREGLEEELHAILREAGLYGSYAVGFVPSLEGVTAGELNAGWSGMRHISFNCFDVD